MNKRRFKQYQVISAIRKADGMVQKAAGILKCEYHTVHRYINDFKAIKQAHKECRDMVADLAETGIIDAIKKDNPDIAVCQWYLKHHRNPYKQTGIIEFEGKLVIGLPDSMGNMAKGKIDNEST